MINEAITGEQLNKQAQDMQREVTTGLRSDQRGLKKTFKEREINKDDLVLKLRRAHDRVRISFGPGWHGAQLCR